MPESIELVGYEMLMDEIDIFLGKNIQAPIEQVDSILSSESILQSDWFEDTDYNARYNKAILTLENIHFNSLLHLYDSLEFDGYKLYTTIKKYIAKYLAADESDCNHYHLAKSYYNNLLACDKTLMFKSFAMDSKAGGSLLEEIFELLDPILFGEIQHVLGAKLLQYKTGFNLPLIKTMAQFLKSRYQNHFYRQAEKVKSINRFDDDSPKTDEDWDDFVRDVWQMICRGYCVILSFKDKENLQFRDMFEKVIDDRQWYPQSVKTRVAGRVILDAWSDLLGSSETGDSTSMNNLWENNKLSALFRFCNEHSKLLLRICFKSTINMDINGKIIEAYMPVRKMLLNTTKSPIKIGYGTESCWWPSNNCIPNLKLNDYQLRNIIEFSSDNCANLWGEKLDLRFCYLDNRPLWRPRADDTSLVEAQYAKGVVSVLNSNEEVIGGTAFVARVCGVNYLFSCLHIFLNDDFTSEREQLAKDGRAELSFQTTDEVVFRVSVFASQTAAMLSLQKTKLKAIKTEESPTVNKVKDDVVVGIIDDLPYSVEPLDFASSEPNIDSKSLQMYGFPVQRIPVGGWVKDISVVPKYYMPTIQLEIKGSDTPSRGTTEEVKKCEGDLKDQFNGYSGAPIANEYGQIVGMFRGIFDKELYATKSQILVDAINNLIKHKEDL